MDNSVLRSSACKEEADTEPGDHNHVRNVINGGHGCEGCPFILPGKVEKSCTVKVELQFGAKTFEYQVFKGPWLSLQALPCLWCGPRALPRALCCWVWGQQSCSAPCRGRTRGGQG